MVRQGDDAPDTPRKATDIEVVKEAQHRDHFLSSLTVFVASYLLAFTVSIALADTSAQKTSVT